LVDAFLEYLNLEKKYSAHTITAYKNDLQSFKKFLEMEYAQENLREVHYSQIRNWIVNLVDIKVSNRTVNRKVSALKSFFTFLQKTKQIDYNPLSKQKLKKDCKFPFLLRK
jgi:integrase/recombinase XerC